MMNAQSMMMTQNISSHSCMKTHTYTQVSLLTVQHDNYSLFTIILKVFILVVFILRRLVKRRMRRGESCHLSRGREEEEEVEGGAAEAGILNVNLQAYFLISVQLVCFSIFLKMFLYSTNPSSTICFSFSACIIEGSMVQKKSKAVVNTENLYQMASGPFALWLCFYTFFLLIWHCSEVTISITLSSVNYSGVVFMRS